MVKNLKVFTIVCLAVLLSLILVACSSTKVKTTGEVPDLGTIRIGYLPVVGYSPFFVGKEKGFFKEQGIDVELERFDSGSKMIPLLASGQLDVGGGEPGTALFNAANQKLDVKVVCGQSSQRLGYAGVPILVRKDLYDSGKITEPSQLAGAKVGINVPRGMAEYTVAKALEKGGKSIADVELVPIPFPDMPAAFANKAIDAANLPFPIAGKVIADGSAVILLGGDEIAGEIQNGVLYFGQRLLDPANREIAIRFLKGYLTSLRYLIDEGYGNEETLKIISNYTGFDPEVISNSTRSYLDPNCVLLSDSLNDIQNYYVQHGYTDYSQPLPLTSVIDESYREAAVDQLGEYEK